MELDKRIKEGKRPLTCFDTEQAKQFIGKKCYFSDDARDFMNLDKADGDTLFYVAELQNIRTAEEYCFADNSNDYRFILPLEWVGEEKKEPEKKYRPYSLEEFFKIFKVGDLIVFRMKIYDEIKCAMYTGYITDGFRIDDKKPGACDVMLGASNYSLFSLFEDFELFYDGEWQPFGVLDEQGARE
jgi:hypothetical protein